MKIAEIPAALLDFRDRAARMAAPESRADGVAHDDLEAIIELLRVGTSHDFRLYKRGTLQRRIERRMAMSGGTVPDMAAYRASLMADPIEMQLLSKDLLINVTSFFRDRRCSTI